VEAAEMAVDVIRRALWVVIVMSAPVLLTGFIVSLFVSLLQSATQIQDLTLSFIPKILAMLLALLVALPWMFSAAEALAVALLREAAQVGL